MYVYDTLTEITNSNINYFRLMKIVKIMTVQFENPV